MIHWKDIKVSTENNGFIHEGKSLFNKQFEEVLKFHSPGLAPVKDVSGWYHIGVKGNALYDNRYERTFGYYFNRASVIKGDSSFHIDEKGKRMYDENYNWTGNFQENLCSVRNSKNEYFHIDLRGKKVYKETYRYAGDFKDGIACVRLQDGFYKHISINGNFINDIEFLDLGVFHKNYATAKDENGWFHINKQGKELYAQRYQLIEPFYNGFAVVDTFQHTKEIINEKGKIIVTL
ncbi:hypothetical protein IMCC3317_06450 [Kordia antarctica]|uniref:Methyltransferase n=1 Tax=Kordia antarctica TaxID=1218801 RepID=A0A7L4ZFM5_9FLAO|nr:WG repeat-containing protein [Kordia antarctica]QHI35299.1 hypothetical protein IMCC3317_06450 [Kordia antarctica]